MDSARLTGMTAAVVSAAAWGFPAPFVRLAADAGIPSPDLVAYRVLLVLAVLVPIAIVARQSLVLDGVGFGQAAALGILSAVTGISYLGSLSFIPIGVAVVILYTFPLIILVTSPIVDGERMAPMRLVAFGIAFAGIIVAIGPSFGGLDLRGLLLVLLASVACAAQFFVGARATRRGRMSALMIWTQATTLPIAIVTAMAVGGPAGPQTVAGAWLPILVCCGCSLIGFFLQMLAMRLAPPAVIGPVFTLEPIVAVLSAAAILGERLTVAQYVGGLLVLTALVAGLLVESRSASLPSPAKVEPKLAPKAGPKVEL